MEIPFFNISSISGNPLLQYIILVMMPVLRCLLTCLLFSGSFASYSQPATNTLFTNYTATVRSPGQDSAFQLLEEALQLMQRSPFKTTAIAWDSLRSLARQQLATATTCRDAHPVIDWCAQQLQLSHSFIMPPKNAAVYSNNTTALQRKPSLRERVGTMRSEWIDGGIGYITIPWIGSSDTATCTLLADSLQSLIGALAQQGATKWIIDLRNNSGGNCWPMLAGTGPLLGNGVCGYFVRDNKTTTIRYENGAAMHGSQTLCKATNPVQLTDRQRGSIVVLTGPGTSSSGEIIALAFKGMNQVRSMGEPTAGFTTANTTYNLLDGSMLVLTVCREADRTGKIHEGKLIPDDLVLPDPLHTADDPAKNAAIMWLQSL